MESLGAESCVLVFYQKKLKRLGSKKGKQIIDNYTILNQIYVEMTKNSGEHELVSIPVRTSVEYRVIGTASTYTCTYTCTYIYTGIYIYMRVCV